MSRHKLLFFVGLACVTLASQASANGRFPRAQRLLVDPVNPERIVLAGTFGLAVTRDAGQSWAYVCESAFADPDAILDPLIGFARDGTLYTGTALDLRRSDPDICEFDVVLGEMDELMPDYTFDVDGQSLLGVVSTIGDEKDRAAIEVSLDGTNWEPLGRPIEERSVLTLDVAPSDAERLYVSALAPELDDDGEPVRQRGVLLVSEDRGESWQELDIPGTSFDAQPFIAAVHPTDPDVLFVRVSGQRLDDLGLPLADDALLITWDAGETWEELVRQPAKAFAFALTPDGDTVWVGFGGPDEATIAADRGQFGFYRITLAAPGERGLDAAVETSQVERVLEGASAHCLTWTPDGWYVCLRQFETGFEVGFTSNHDFTSLDELTPLLLLNEVGEPSTCPEGSEAAVCSDLWQTDCQRLLSCGRSAMPDAGPDAVGGTTDDGRTGSPNAAPTGQVSSGDPEQSSDCSCRLADTRRWSDSGAPAMLALLALGWASRRSRARIPRMRKRRPECPCPIEGP